MRIKKSSLVTIFIVCLASTTWLSSATEEDTADLSSRVKRLQEKKKISDAAKESSQSETSSESISSFKREASGTGDVTSTTKNRLTEKDTEKYDEIDKKLSKFVEGRLARSLGDENARVSSELSTSLRDVICETRVLLSCLAEAANNLRTEISLSPQSGDSWLSGTFLSSDTNSSNNELGFFEYGPRLVEAALNDPEQILALPDILSASVPTTRIYSSFERLSASTQTLLRELGTSFGNDGILGQFVRGLNAMRALQDGVSEPELKKLEGLETVLITLLPSIEENLGESTTLIAEEPLPEGIQAFHNILNTLRSINQLFNFAKEEIGLTDGPLSPIDDITDVPEGAVPSSSFVLSGLGPLANLQSISELVPLSQFTVGSLGPISQLFSPNSLLTNVDLQSLPEDVSFGPTLDRPEDYPYEVTSSSTTTASSPSGSTTSTLTSSRVQKPKSILASKSSPTRKTLLQSAVPVSLASPAESIAVSNVPESSTISYSSPAESTTVAYTNVQSSPSVLPAKPNLQLWYSDNIFPPAFSAPGFSSAVKSIASSHPLFPPISSAITGLSSVYIPEENLSSVELPESSSISVSSPSGTVTSTTSETNIPLSSSSSSSVKYSSIRPINRRPVIPAEVSPVAYSTSESVVSSSVPASPNGEVPRPRLHSLVKGLIQSRRNPASSAPESSVSSYVVSTSPSPLSNSPVATSEQSTITTYRRPVQPSRKSQISVSSSQIESSGPGSTTYSGVSRGPARPLSLTSSPAGPSGPLAVGLVQPPVVDYAGLSSVNFPDAPIAQYRPAIPRWFSRPVASSVSKSTKISKTSPGLNVYSSSAEQTVAPVVASAPNTASSTVTTTTSTRTPSGQQRSNTISTTSVTPSPVEVSSVTPVVPLSTTIPTATISTSVSMSPSRVGLLPITPVTKMLNGIISSSSGLFQPVTIAKPVASSSSVIAQGPIVTSSTSSTSRPVSSTISASTVSPTGTTSSVTTRGPEGVTSVSNTAAPRSGRIRGGSGASRLITEKTRTWKENLPSIVSRVRTSTTVTPNANTPAVTTVTNSASPGQPTVTAYTQSVSPGQSTVTTNTKSVNRAQSTVTSETQSIRPVQPVASSYSNSVSSVQSRVTTPSKSVKPVQSTVTSYSKSARPVQPTATTYTNSESSVQRVIPSQSRSSISTSSISSSAAPSPLSNPVYVQENRYRVHQGPRLPSASNRPVGIASQSTTVSSSQSLPVNSQTVTTTSSSASPVASSLPSSPARVSKISRKQNILPSARSSQISSITSTVSTPYGPVSTTATSSSPLPLGQMQVPVVMPISTVKSVTGGKALQIGDIIAIILRSKTALLGRVVDPQQPVVFDFLMPSDAILDVQEGVRIWQLAIEDFRNSECYQDLTRILLINQS